MRKTLSIVAAIAAVSLSSIAVVAQAQTPPTPPQDPAQRGQPERPRREGPPRGRQGGPPNVELPSVDGFEQGMNRAGRGLRALKSSSFDAATQDADLGAMNAIEAGLVTAKSNAAAVPMSKAAQAKFGTDQNAYQVALRTALVDGLRQALAVDTALLAKDGAKAKSEFEKLVSIQEASHALFQPEQPAKPERGAPPARP